MNAEKEEMTPCEEEGTKVLTQNCFWEKRMLNKGDNDTRLVYQALV